MHPRSVIFVAVGLGLLGTAVPIAGAVYLSWQAAVADDTQRLSQLADQAIDRTVFMFNQATQVLHTIKGRDVRLGRGAGFQGFARRFRDVGRKSTMCAIANFSNHSREDAHRRIGSHEP
jgi:hypothetical protein